MFSGGPSASGAKVAVSPTHRGVGRARTSMNGEITMAAKKGARKGGKKAAKKGGRKGGAKKAGRKTAKKGRR
jgi:hypothetical protein